MEITFVRIDGISILPVLIISRASGNSPALVLAPLTSSSFFVIVPVGISVSVLGHPVKMTRPAFLTRSNELLMAGVAPDASMTTSARFPPQIFFTSSGRSHFAGFTVYLTPSLSAVLSLSSTGSERIGVAPYDWAARAARRPIGPAPEITICSPAVSFAL